MLQSQKIISCLLSIAVIFGIMLTITCMAVENNPQEGDGTSQSSKVEDTSSEEGNTEESSEEEESEAEETESSEESSEESREETSREQESTGDKYYYSGDVSYPPYTGSRVLKNPNMVEEESKSEENAKPVEKDIKDWSYVARRWVALPVIFTLLSLGGLIWFNLYVKKQNGKDDRRRARRRENAKEKSDAEKSGRNFERPKH